MKYKKQLLFFLYNIIVLLLLFSLLELFVRVSFPGIQLPGTSSELIYPNKYGSTHGLNPNASGLSNGVFKKVNGEGFWEYSGNSNQADTSDAIMILGDSATMGIGVEDDSTFAGIISRLLPKKHILNPSLIAYTVNDYLNVVNYLIDSTGNKFNIKHLLICWCLNDVYPNHPVENAPGVVEEDLLSILVKFIRNNFETYQWLKTTFADRSESYYMYDKEYYSYDNSDFTRSVGAINKIKQVAGVYNINLEVVILPYEYQIRNFDNNDIRQPQHILASKLSEYNIKTIDVSSAFRQFQTSSSSLYLYGDGIHFSRLGHKTAAQFIFNNIFRDSKN